VPGLWQVQVLTALGAYYILAGEPSDYVAQRHDTVLLTVCRP
jgi:hypothetical protein